MPKFNDITGQTFGKLTAIRVIAKTKRGPVWLFRCECGNKTERSSTLVTTGHTTSCGCVRRQKCGDRNRTHGESPRSGSTKEYRAWVVMNRRCYDRNLDGGKHWHNYGGRGIQVCKRWRKSFKAFLKDMGRAPSPQHTLDRYPDNNGNYEPSNCRWATRQEQFRNFRRNRWITFNGERKILYDWAEQTGVHYATLISRLDRLGWSVEKALTTPARKIDLTSRREP